MSEPTVIQAAIRSEKGKGTARKLRSNKSIPAVLYGHKVDPVMLSIKNSEIYKVLQSEDAGTGTSNLIKVRYGKNEKLVMIREIQQHPFKHNILHIDLFAVNIKEKIHAPVHIKIIGEAPGAKTGGVLRQIMREVEVQALPTDIPPYFEVDVSELEIGDSIHVSNLTVPENVKILADEQAPIVNVITPTLQKTEEEEAEESEEGAEEGTETEAAEKTSTESNS